MEEEEKAFGKIFGTILNRCFIFEIFKIIKLNRRQKRNVVLTPTPNSAFSEASLHDLRNGTIVKDIFIFIKT